MTSQDSAAKAGFINHVNLDHVAAGSEFAVTWSFTNDGSTTWNGGYRYAYTEEAAAETAAFQRSPLRKRRAVPIHEVGAPDPVPPGGTVHLRMTFKAPKQPGTYATNWQLQNPEGQNFGPVRWLRAVVSEAAAGEALAIEFLDFQNSVGSNRENMQPGRAFEATWTLRNSGTQPWTGDFQIAYVDRSTLDTADALRDQMGAPAVTTLREVSGRESVQPGDRVTLPIPLLSPKQPGAYAFHWELRDAAGQPFGGTRWMRIGVVGEGQGTPPQPTKGTKFGMNVNIQPGGHPLDEERLAGLGWVRWVFWASRLKKSPAEAYQDYYKSRIQRYADKGIRSLIILHQDTYWGNAPWDNGGWEEYARQFGIQCGKVAAACSEFGDMVAYQVYNEQDSGPDNHSAIGFAAEHYALVLDNASREIRANHTGAKVIFGGLMTGPHSALQYVRDTQAALGGRLPVDALAMHPYGRYVKTPFFNFGSIGRLGDSFQIFKEAYPQMPLWVTEIGVAADSHIGSEHYEKIGTYIREVVNDVANNHAAQVPVLIWFGWTDLMRNAGINTVDGKPKPHVYDAFEMMKNRSRMAAREPLLGDVDRATFIAYSTTLDNLNAVPAGETFTSRWTFQNSGTTTWGAGYELVYAPKGDNPAAMVSAERCPLSEVADKAEVAPGERVTITLEMRAPELAGRTYRSQWQLRDPQGEMFGFLYEELTVEPAPTAGTGAWASGMTFVSDQTIPDNTRLLAGTDFEKQWLVTNTGSRQWGDSFRLVFVEGDLNMARGVASHQVPKAKPGDTVTLTIKMTAPPAQDGLPTTYSSLWRMEDDHGNVFGDPIWARIVATPAIAEGAGVNTPLARLLNDSSTWYSQLDAQWQEDILGTGTATIGSWGCLMTCMAMTLTAFGSPLNPQELNKKAIDAGVFDGSAIRFSAPGTVGQLSFDKNVKSWPDSDVKFAVWTDEDPIQRIDEALAEGLLVLAQVDTKPNNGFYNADNEQHWVVIVKRTPDGKDYLMIDPLTLPQHAHTQPRSLMMKYGDVQPSATNETNLRNAIKSTLVYHRPGGGS